MSVINWPMLYIPDPDKGRPLFSGQIYVGIEDLDPAIAINQKQLNVIQEDGTVVPVSQPFILSAGGVPVYNGSPVRLDVDGNYSIKILNKLGAQTYYIGNVYEGQPVTTAELAAALAAAAASLIDKNYIASKTLAEAKADADAYVGKYVRIADRDNGLFKYVAATTNNERNICECTGITASLELQNIDVINVKQWGAIADGDELNPEGSTDNTAVIQAAIDYAETLVFTIPGIDPQGGMDITIPSGSYVITSALRVSKGNISIRGESMATIIPYMPDISPTSCACFIVGTGEEWLSSGTISSTTKYNSISGLRFSRLSGPSPIAIMLTGCRNLDLSRIHVERLWCGVWCENVSETTFNQISMIGTNYGIIGDSRKNRPSGSSPLGVANVDNDMSANTWQGIICYYPQHTGILLINSGTTSIIGGTIGRFSDNPDTGANIRYGLSGKPAAIHYWGGNTNFTKGGLLSDIVYEPDANSNRACILVTSENQLNPIRGLVFDEQHVQTWGSNYAAGVYTRLLKVEAYNGGKIDGCVLRNSGFTMATSGFDYPVLIEKTPDSDVGFTVDEPNFILQDNYPSAALSTSTVGHSVITNNYLTDIVSMEAADLGAGNLPAGWVAGSGTINTGGGSGGVEPHLNFVGNSSGLSQMSFTRRFRTYSTRIGSIYFSFWYKGDTAPYVNITVNNVTATEITTQSGDNQGRYSNALYTANNLPVSSGWRRVVLTFLPFSTGAGDIDTVKFEVGRSINGNTNYTDIKGIEIGYNTRHESKYNVFS